MGTTAELVDFCDALTYKSLPAEIVDKVKFFALDFIGVAARGSLTESSQAIYRFVREMGLKRSGCAVIGTGMRTLGPFAALANGTSSHSVDMEDVSNKASLHPGVVIFPAALAASEISGCDGQRFAEGVVLGYEVMVRMGMALNPVSLYSGGFYPSAICGVFGATVAASKVLGLDKKQMLNALGIAGSQASGIMEFSLSGGWNLRLHTGWAAHCGMMAALMAETGFEGPSAVLEGKYGVLNTFSKASDQSKILSRLGESYEIAGISIKPYPSCRYEHAPIEGILKIMNENRLKPSDVKEVTIGILKAGWNIVAEPLEIKRTPKTLGQLSSSMHFGAAAAILYGDVNLEQYNQDNLNSPEIRDLMCRVSCVQDPELDKVFPEQWPATVKIVTRDGREFSCRIDYPKGDPKNPFTWEELIAKYQRLASAVFSESRRSEILRRVKALEQESSMKSFCSLLLADIK